MTQLSYSASRWHAPYLDEDEDVWYVEKMTLYSLDPENASKLAKARGSHLRVHFKNTLETAQTIKRMHLRRAVVYVKEIVYLEKLECSNRQQHLQETHLTS